MMLSQLRQIGWAGTLLAATALVVALWIHVNNVKSEVRMAERKIVALKSETMMLETEFETRANQSQLAAWNAVDFGYRPPASDQFLDGEQALAEFGTPRAEGAPAPIRVARAGAGKDAPEFAVPEAPTMLSPLTGKPLSEAAADVVSPQEGKEGSRESEPSTAARIAAQEMRASAPDRRSTGTVRVPLGSATLSGARGRAGE